MFLLVLHRQHQGWSPCSLSVCHQQIVICAAAAAGMAFCGVHDSFWTHPCDADTLGVQLREAFVELHSQPLLEDLHRQLVERYPKIAIPDLPDRPEDLDLLDLEKVKEADYFFN